MTQRRQVDDRADVRRGPSDPFDGPDWDQPAPAPASTPAADTGETRRRQIRVSRRTRRRHRRIGLAMIIVGAAILLLGAWLAITGLLARGQLNAVRAEVHRLRTDIVAGDLTGARSTVAQISTHARRAHRLTSGPVWALAARVPLGGEPLHTVRGITAGADALSRTALPELIGVSTQLDPATLRRPDGTVDLARMAAVAPQLQTATAAMAEATASISHLPHHTWLSPVDTARSDLLSQLGAIGHDLSSANLSVHIAPALLGQDGPKRYFVAFQNEAEARGTGGLAGAFAILQADHGKLTFTRFGDRALGGVSADLDFGADYTKLYGGATTMALYGNANISPNFPYAAQIWAAMWQKHSGEHLDGAIAVDPTALSYLLAVSGPAMLPDHTTITAGNIVAYTQSTVYARFANDTARHQYQLAIARAVGTKVLAGAGDTTALVNAAGRAAGERRLLVWSADPGVEAQLAQTAVSGVIPVTTEPYVGLSIVNGGGNKLDYYLERSLTWKRTGCGSSRHVTVTITLRNDAPNGLPGIVTGRYDRHTYPVRPGDSRLEVGYFATDGALMNSVTVNGRPATAAIGAERGHPVYTVDLEVPRATSRTVVLHLSEPAGKGEPIVLRQPLVRPLHVTLDEAQCG